MCIDGSSFLVSVGQASSILFLSVFHDWPFGQKQTVAAGRRAKESALRQHCPSGRTEKFSLISRKTVMERAGLSPPGWH